MELLARRYRMLRTGLRRSRVARRKYVALAARSMRLEPLEPRTLFSATTVDPAALLVAAANNAFAFDMYQQLVAADQGQNSNIFFSPYSIATALEMTLQ